MVGVQAGDVLLVRRAGTVAWLIRLGERARYAGWPRTLRWLAESAVGVAGPDGPADPWWPNHAAVVVSPTEVIEAQAQGLVSTPLARFDTSHVAVLRLDDVQPFATQLERTNLVRFARAQLARHGSYGWLSILSIVVQLLTPAKLDISWDGSLTCSAFAAQCLEHAGVTLPTRSSLTTMPADLAAMIPKTRPGGRTTKGSVT